MLDRGSTRYLSRVNRSIGKGSEGYTSYGITLLKRGVEPLAQAIGEFMSKANSGKPGRRHYAVHALSGISADVAAFLTLRAVLDCLTLRASLQDVAIRVGREIEMESQLALYEEQDPERYRRLGVFLESCATAGHKRRSIRHSMKHNSAFTGERWRKELCLHTGIALLEMAMQATGFFRQEQEIDPYDGKRKTIILVPALEIEAWLKEHTEAMSILMPDYLPTVLEPKPWDAAFGGGYYNTVMRPLPLVKKCRKEYHALIDERIRAGKMDEVLECVNTLQATPWKINEPVLAVLKHLWLNTDGGMAGIPHIPDTPYPPCPVCGQPLHPRITPEEKEQFHPCFLTLAPEAKKQWGKATYDNQREIHRLLSVKLSFGKVLNLALRFAREERFHFPYQLDFRGRIYAVPAYLNPQGMDVAKGLLQFAEAKPLVTQEAADWLAIHGANCFGVDKISLADRIAWVKSHEAEILASAENPYDNRFWQDADSPWCFLAFCYEWQGYKREGLSFASALPIAMDGSCNGLQLYSLLFKDEAGGAATNLIPAETPSDIYGIVAARVKDELEQIANTDPEQGIVMSKDGSHSLYNKVTCARWLLKETVIDRKMTKRQVMVLPYGGTKRSCVEYTLEWLRSWRPIQGSPHAADCANGHTFQQVSAFLADLIWKAIADTVIKAREAMTFLQKTATLFNKARASIEWTTPSGFPVRQRYLTSRGTIVKTRMGDRLVYLSLADELDERDEDHLDARRQTQAIAPNFIHSLDAAALCRTVRLSRGHGLTHFAMIHDSYGTHATNTPQLARLLREAFVDMFGSGKENLVASWLSETGAVLPDKLKAKLPPIPESGKLNVEALRDSKFFFA